MLTENKRRSVLLYPLIISFFAILKLSQLLTSTEPFLAYEEATNGCFANDFLNGKLLMGIYDYQAYPHSGGTLILGIFAVPFFVLFGKSIISLKLIPLIFSLLTLAIWFRMIERFFNTSTAVIFSALYILSSDLLCRGELIAWGNHCESNLFTISIAAISVQLLDQHEKTNKCTGLLIVLGVIAGLGIYFDYIYAITLLALFASFFLTNRAVLTFKNIFYFVLSFIAGFFPWILYRVYSSTAGSESSMLFSKVFSNRMDLNFSPFHIAKRAYSIIVNDIPSSLSYINIPSNLGKTATYTLLALFSTSIVFYLLDLLKYKHLKFFYLFPISFIVVFFGTFFFSGLYNPAIPEREWFFISKYRYYLPVLPFIYFFAAWGAGSLLTKTSIKPAKYFSLLILAPALLGGAGENIAYIAPSSFLSGTVSRGYSYWELLPNYLLKTRSRQELENLIENLGREAAVIYFSDIGKHFAETAIKEPELTEKLTDKRDNSLKSALHLGIGRGIFNKFDEDINAVKKTIDNLPEAWKHEYFEGYIFEASKAYSQYTLLDNGAKCEWEINRALRLIDTIDENFKPAAYRGLARSIMEVELFVSTSKILPPEKIMPKCLSIISKIPSGYKDAVKKGLAFEYSLYWLAGLQQSAFTKNFISSNAESAFNKLLGEKIAKIILASSAFNSDETTLFLNETEKAARTTFFDAEIEDKVMEKLNSQGKAVN